MLGYCFDVMGFWLCPAGKCLRRVEWVIGFPRELLVAEYILQFIGTTACQTPQVGVKSLGFPKPLLEAGHPEMLT